MNSLTKAFILALGFATSSCTYLEDYFKQKEVEEVAPLARVEDTFLYNEDISGLVPKNVSSSDSAKLAEKYVNDWVKKQLLIKKAQEEISLDQADIERKILDYRFALIVHEFEKLYIDSHLNTLVDQEEIEEYYTERSDNFLLKQNIIRCLFVQIPKSAPGLNQIRRNIRSYPDTNKEDITEYCYQYAIRSFLDDSLWVNFDEVIQNTPMQEMNDKIQFLRRNSFNETSDDDYIYLLRILEYKISDEISPLAYIREDIENIIINKRKLALKKELEKAIYDEALVQKSFEIYNN